MNYLDYFLFGHKAKKPRFKRYDTRIKVMTFGDGRVQYQAQFVDRRDEWEDMSLFDMPGSVYRALLEEFNDEERKKLTEAYAKRTIDLWLEHRRNTSIVETTYVKYP